MGANKRTTTQDSTTTQTPFASPDIRFGLDQNRNLFNQLQGRTAPDFQTVAGFSPATQSGLDATIARGLSGSPATDAGQGAVADIASSGIFGPGGVPTNAAAQFFEPTARGDFLDFSNNPAFQRGVETINDSVGSIFERAGRTGSGANQSSVARGVGDFAAGTFNQERQNQLAASRALADIFQGDINNQISNTAGRLNAAGLAPGLAGTDFTDLQAVLGAGGAIDAKTQQQINDQIARFNQPFDNAIQAQGLLNAGIGGLGPLLGGTVNEDSTTVERTSPNLLGSILGGALTAGSLFGTGGAFPLGGGGGGGGVPLDAINLFPGGGAQTGGFTPGSIFPVPQTPPISLFRGA